MTVVVWDGKTLAADKMNSLGGTAATVTKVFHLGPTDELVGIAGNGTACMEWLDWYRNGANPATFPPSLRDKDLPTQTLVVKRATAKEYVRIYDNTPFPMRCEGSRHAIGGGRDYALGAMAMGADAKRAVEITNELSTFCGRGVDTLTFES